MKAIIVNSGTGHVDDVRLELLEWARNLGVDARRAKATFVLIQDADGWRGHFSMKRQRDGHDYVEPGANRVATDFGIFVVPVESWPEWFPVADTVPDIAAADLLELLDVADEQALQLRHGSLRRSRDAEAARA